VIQLEKRKKLNEIMHQLKWDQIEKTLSAYYIDELREAILYKKVFWNLFQIQPADNTEEIDIVVVGGLFEDGEEFADVFGSKKGEQPFYTLEYCSWAEWLGFYLNDEYSDDEKAEIFTHCLVEMTIYGFEPDSATDEYDSMLKENKQEAQNLRYQPYYFEEIKETEVD
jgi:hypothetical protein